MKASLCSALGGCAFGIAAGTHLARQFRAISQAPRRAAGAAVDPMQQTAQFRN